MLSVPMASRFARIGCNRGSQMQARSFWNVSLKEFQGAGGAHLTKYKIAKPGKDGVEWDDFLLALPERDQLASMTKEVPLFIRHLKMVTEQEGRHEAFNAFVERAKSGLVVESDVFITTDELAAVMWKNGYSEEELKAIQNTFPSDYKFHYPELSVLFDLSEEDTYKFAMRTRMEASHIGELDWEKVKPAGLLRTHWLAFGTGIFIFKSFPFFSYYFGIKVFGTSMWCYTMWSVLNRLAAKTFRRNEYMAAQKTAQDVMQGEDKIMDAMKRFKNDTKCVDHLAGFKSETEEKISVYKRALVLKMKAELSERATKQLQSIAAFEASSGAALQELVVAEAAASFREKFPTDAAMQTQAFSSSLLALSGEPVNTEADPVARHFNEAFASLQGADLANVTADARGSLAERVAHAQKIKEAEFQQSFMVTASEASEVRDLVSQAKAGNDYDFSQLSAESLQRLEELYLHINAKVGFALPASLGSKSVAASDEAARGYAEQVNSQLTAVATGLRDARLKAFAQSFA